MKNEHVFSVGPVLADAIHSDFRFIGLPLYKNRKYLEKNWKKLADFAFSLNPWHLGT